MDGFWPGDRRLDKEPETKLAYTTYSRRRVTHTASVQWRPSNDSTAGTDRCCDVRLSIDAETPRGLDYPPGSQHKITSTQLTSFLSAVRQKKNLGIIARYGFSAPTTILSFFKGIKITQVSADVGDDTEPVLQLNVFRRDSDALLVVEPRHRLVFLEEEASDTLFAAPLGFASKLAQSLPSNATEEGV